MKFELKDKTGKDFSVALGGINDERVEAEKKKKKEELRDIGFTFNTDAERNYWLENYPDATIRINISTDGTMVATKTDNSEISAKEKQEIDAVVKKMYVLLGFKEDQYHSVAGIGTGSAGATPSPLPPTKNYHTYLATHADALNAALKPHHYQVNGTTLEKIDASGHKIMVNEDGSTKGDLFADLSDANAVAKNIADDHIAVIKMHLALSEKGIQPTKKINLFLIKENLSVEDKAKLPAIEAKIKELLVAELKKPEYKDIKKFIVYDGVPLEEKAAAASKPAPAAPPAEKKPEKEFPDILFEDKPGRVQYCEISKTRNEPLFNAVNKLDKAKLKEGITQLCESDPKFRHALIETAPHYIYFNNGDDEKFGVGENGLGGNQMGIALMEVRNNLFQAKDSKHPLIVDTAAFRLQAMKERGDVDNLVGTDQAEGKSILDLMRKVREAPKADAGARPLSPRK